MENAGLKLDDVVDRATWKRLMQSCSREWERARR